MSSKVSKHAGGRPKGEPTVVIRVQERTVNRAIDRAAVLGLSLPDYLETLTEKDCKESVV